MAMLRTPMQALTSLLALSFLACGCTSLVFFDQISHRQRYHLTPDDVAGLQFYLHNEIELSRVMGEDELGVPQGHELILRDGLRVEIVRFPHGIPGVAHEVGDDSILMRFELLPEDDGHLRFAVPNKLPSDLPNDIFRFYVFHAQSVEYAGREYTVKVTRARTGDVSPANCAVLRIRSSAFKNRNQARSVQGLRFPSS